VNRALEVIHGIMENVRIAPTKQHVRLQFDLEGTRKKQERALQELRQSSVFERVVPLGPVHPE